MNKEIIQLLIKIRPFVMGGVALLITNLLTYFFTVKHFKNQKYHEFDQKRFDEFYGPMIGIVKQIRANVTTRLKVFEAEGQAWKEICANQPRPFLEHKKYFEPYKNGILYENERFKKEDLPSYDKMLKIFKDKMYLVYPSTKKWFEQFSQYVDHWHRPIPREALMKLNISEGPLLEFYKDIEECADNLREKLSGEK